MMSSNKTKPTQDYVELEIDGESFTGNMTESILEQAEEQGFELSYGCRSGVCGSCKIVLLSGDVHCDSDIPLNEEEKQENIILACSCMPKTNIKLATID